MLRRQKNKAEEGKTQVSGAEYCMVNRVAGVYRDARNDAVQLVSEFDFVSQNDVGALARGCIPRGLVLLEQGAVILLSPRDARAARSVRRILGGPGRGGDQRHVNRIRYGLQIAQIVHVIHVAHLQGHPLTGKQRARVPVHGCPPVLD